MALPAADRFICIIPFGRAHMAPKLRVFIDYFCHKAILPPQQSHHQQRLRSSRRYQTGRRCWRFVSLRRPISPKSINRTALRTKWAEGATPDDRFTVGRDSLRRSRRILLLSNRPVQNQDAPAIATIFTIQRHKANGKRLLWPRKFADKVVNRERQHKTQQRRPRYPDKNRSGWFAYGRR